MKAGRATALSYQSPVVHVATPLAVYPASQENDTVLPSAVLRPTAVPPAMFAVVKPGEVVQRLSLVSVNTAATYISLQREEREKKVKKKVGSMSNRIVGRTTTDSSYAPLAPQMAWTVTDASFDALQAITLDATLDMPLFPWVPETMLPLVSISRDTFQTMPRFPATVVETVIEYVLPGA